MKKEKSFYFFYTLINNNNINSDQLGINNINLFPPTCILESLILGMAENYYQKLELTLLRFCRSSISLTLHGYKLPM